MTMLVTDNVVLYYGRSDEFSHHHHSPFRIKHMHFSCVEQHLMYCKARLFNDYEVAREIMEASDPAAMMRLGREVKDYNEGVWGNKRMLYITAGNFAKYRQNPELRKILLDTGDRTLGEATRSKVWGIGLSKTDEAAINPANWSGLNLAGMALMSIRATLQTEASLL